MVVYKIRNILNNKVYIGYTKRDPIPYIESHFSNAMNNLDIHSARLKGRLDFQGKYFYNAIRKYGRDSFEYRILCECYSIEDVKQAERIFIQYYSSTNNQLGYNIAEGGDGGNTRLGMTREDLIQYSLNQSKSMKRTLSTPDAKKRLSDNQRLNWTKEEYKIKQLKSRPARIQKFKEKINRLLIENPELKEKWSASKKTKEFSLKKKQEVTEFWSDPENKRKRGEIFSNSESFRKARIVSAKNQWQDPKFAEIMKQRNDRPILALRTKYDSLLEHKYSLLDYKELRKILDCSLHMINRVIPELMDLGKISKWDDLYLVI